MEFIHLSRLGVTIGLAFGNTPNELGVSIACTRKPDQFAKFIGRRITSGRINAAFTENKNIPNTKKYALAKPFDQRDLANKIRKLIREQSNVLEAQVLRDQLVGQLFYLIDKAVTEGDSK